MMYADTMSGTKTISPLAKSRFQDEDAIHPVLSASRNQGFARAFLRGDFLGPPPHRSVARGYITMCFRQLLQQRDRDLPLADVPPNALLKRVIAGPTGVGGKGVRVTDVGFNGSVGVGSGDRHPDV